MTTYGFVGQSAWTVYKKRGFRSRYVQIFFFQNLRGIVVSWFLPSKPYLVKTTNEARAYLICSTYEITKHFSLGPPVVHINLPKLSKNT